MNLMVSRLCQAAAFAPMAINLHCEQILCDLSRFDPPRFIRIAVPYATVPTGGSEGTTLLAVCVMLSVRCAAACIKSS